MTRPADVVRILGVDPGLTRCGIAVVDVDARRRAVLVHVEVVGTPPETSLDRRLLRIDEAVTAVRIERRKPGWWTLAGVLQNLFFLATVIGALWLVIQLVLLLTGVDVTAGSTLLWIIPGALLLIGITGSVITSLAAASARRKGAKEAADDVAERLTQAVHSAAASSYLAPITGVLREHREVYDSLR